MTFEKFKAAIKSMSLDELNKEIQERKKTLFKWNQPIERQVDIGQYNPQTKMANIRSKHPHRKIKKELAILNTIVHQRLNKQ